METTTPNKQPQRIVRAWSPDAISGATLLTMIVLALLGIIFGLLSISTALALGAGAGVIASAVNCFRLGRRWTGFAQLLISPLIYLLIPVGLPLALATIVKLSAGSPERIHEVYQSFTPFLIFILYCGTAGLVCVYLYHATQRSIAHVQARGTTVEFAATRSLLVIVTISCVCVWGATTLVARAYLDSIASRIYCDFLEAYKPEQEIRPERVGFYSDPDPTREIYFPPSERLTYYQRLDWNSHEYDLWVWIGYDVDGNLGWRIKGLARNDKAMSCPWTLSQSVTAR